MMTTNMTGGGRYKLIRLLDQAEGWSAYSALDIERSTRDQVLINIYHGAQAVRCMVARCYGMDQTQCSDFSRMYTEDGTFTTVFALHEGAAFDDSFPKRGGPDEELRMDYAETLLHTALERTGMPAELLAAMLTEKNIVVQEKNRRLALNAAIPPVTEEGASPARALSPLLERILMRRWSACDEQIAFMDKAASGGFETVSALYSAWRELVPVMVQDRKTGWLSKMIRAVKRWLRNWMDKKKKESIARRRAMDD